ncbi:hypothetical protein PMAYCL1PPCAC_20081, partial [Pristionchus mayeri]
IASVPVITCLLMCLVTVTTPFWHMFYVLKQQTNKSERSKVLIRQSLMRLCTQLNVPLFFLVIPCLIYFIQFEIRCFPFRVPLLAMFIVPLHPIIHNLVLLFIMP